MNEKTCRLLEFDRVKERVAAYARSSEAASLILAEPPLSDAAALAALQRELCHLIARVNSADGEPRRELPETAPLFAKLALERAALSLEEAFALGVFLEEGARVLCWAKLDGDKGAGEAEADGAEAQTAEAEAGAALIFAVVAPDGSMRELPELRRIKERIRAIGREIKKMTASFARDESTRAMLQSDLPSMRDGRTVLALKANFRGRVRGIVHEVSASGQTLFIEPEALVEKNNELRIEERALDAEIRRILRELTASLAPRRKALLEFHARLVRLDALRARAHFAAATKGALALAEEAEAEGGAALRLEAARHPLLGGEVVPIDITLREGVRALIITGPNAGGKTAALKTAGLFALMNQAGFALPCARARLPVFDDVLADIGDEQSLQGALSTFSAHAQNLAAIHRAASSRSLVLLDELGAGTGVEEGGALAMALLDSLIDRGAALFVTTHASALKKYGWTRSAVENASMEFDTATGKPTYRVIMGVPGESRALAIARRSGLPRELIDSARAYLDRGESASARVISGLQTKITNLERDRRAFEEERRAFERERQKLEERAARLREKEAALKAGDLRELRALRDASRKKLENLVRALQEGAGAPVGREKTSAVKGFLRELDEEVREEEAAFEAENAPRAKAEDGTPPLGAHEIEPGLAVLVGARRRPGVVKKRAKRGLWLVEVGSLSLSAAPDDLYPAPPAALRPAAAAFDLAPSSPARAELDLRGFRLGEALEALETQLDAALAANLGAFAVIHGTGDGILQRGVHEYLKTQAPVADYYFSRPELGGTGRTEVILR
jgi:DNA mismatch repair protein MutS2